MEAAEESKKTIKGYIPHLRELEELDYAELSVLKLKFIQLNLKGSNEMLEEIAELLVNKRDEVKVPAKGKEFKNNATYCVGTGRMGLALQKEYLDHLKIIYLYLLWVYTLSNIF